MMHRNQRVMTLAVALLVLAVPFTVAVSDDDTLEESEGIVPFIIVGYAGWTLVASFIAGAAVGIGGSLIWDMNTDTSPSDDETRRVEAQLMAEALMTGIPLYTNAIENYANIWTLTGEHWVRQAELAAASYWSFGSEYDATAVMDGSRIYYNDAVMMANATNQINAQSSSTSMWANGTTPRSPSTTATGRCGCSSSSGAIPSRPMQMTLSPHAWEPSSATSPPTGTRSTTPEGRSIWTATMP